MANRGFLRAAVLVALQIAYIEHWRLPVLQVVPMDTAGIVQNDEDDNNKVHRRMEEATTGTTGSSELKEIDKAFKGQPELLTPLRPIDLDQYTIRMLSWKRPDLLAASVAWYSKCPGVHQIQIVWSRLQEQDKEQDNGSEPYRVPSEVIHNPKVHVEYRDTNVLTNRFDILSSTPTETLGILNLDDDQLFTCDALDTGFFQWVQEPERMLSFFPRTHAINKKNNQWHYTTKYHSNPEGASLGLTGAAFLHRDYLHAYTHYLPRNIYQDVQNNMNCEDISMSLFLSSLTNSRPPNFIDEWVIFSRVTLERNSSKIGVGGATGLSRKNWRKHIKRRSYCVDTYASQLGLKGEEYNNNNGTTAVASVGVLPQLMRQPVQSMTTYNLTALASSLSSSPLLDNPRFVTLSQKLSNWTKLPPQDYTNHVLVSMRQTLHDYAASCSLEGWHEFMGHWRTRYSKVYKAGH